MLENGLFQRVSVVPVAHLFCSVLSCRFWGTSLLFCASLCRIPLSCTSLKTPSVVFSFQLQVNLLSKFLLIAKSCYEQRNFATAMQILGGLEHLAVRQSPVRHVGFRGLRVWANTQDHKISLVFSSQAWKILPAKIAEVMEELKAVEVCIVLCRASPERLAPCISGNSQQGIRNT